MLRQAHKHRDRSENIIAHLLLYDSNTFGCRKTERKALLLLWEQMSTIKKRGVWEFIRVFQMPAATCSQLHCLCSLAFLFIMHLFLPLNRVKYWLSTTLAAARQTTMHNAAHIEQTSCSSLNWNQKGMCWYISFNVPS